jgi:hypothetical protein
VSADILKSPAHISDAARLTISGYRHSHTRNQRIEPAGRPFQRNSILDPSAFRESINASAARKSPSRWLAGSHCSAGDGSKRGAAKRLQYWKATAPAFSIARLRFVRSKSANAAADDCAAY